MARRTSWPSLRFWSVRSSIEDARFGAYEAGMRVLLARSAKDGECTGARIGAEGVDDVAEFDGAEE